jgi:hypothetical protein
MFPNNKKRLLTYTIRIGCGSDHVYALSLFSANKYLLRYDGDNSLFKEVDELVNPFQGEEGGGPPDKGFCTAADDIWILRYCDIAHGNGQQWNILDIEAPETEFPPGFVNLFVTPDERCFAVGFTGAVFYSDSSTFRQVASGTEAKLYALWGTDKDHIYAVGERGTILEGNTDHLNHVYPLFDHGISHY